MTACTESNDPVSSADTTLVLPLGSTAPTTLPAPATTDDPAAWPGRPEPCALLADDHVREAVGFAVTAGPLGSADGGGPHTCAWRNAEHGLEGGAVTLRLIPPSRAVTTEGLLEVRSVEGLGFPTYVGAVPGALGAGTTAVVVDVGNGGFGLVLSTYEYRTEEEALLLARQAIERWELAGGTTASPSEPLPD